MTEGGAVLPGAQFGARIGRFGGRKRVLLPFSGRRSAPGSVDCGVGNVCFWIGRFAVQHPDRSISGVGNARLWVVRTAVVRLDRSIFGVGNV